MDDCGSTIVSSAPTIAQTGIFFGLLMFASVSFTEPLNGASISENETDALVKFSRIGNTNRYFIHLANYPSMYLTTKHDGYAVCVYWSELVPVDGTCIQYWDITEVDMPRTVVDLPVDRVYNWNQFYTDLRNVINSPAGCAWTCGLDVSNIYGPEQYEPEDLSFAWNSVEGYNWSLPIGCSAAFNFWSHFDDNTDFYSIIRSEINNNRPVVVKMCTHTNSEDTHFVVAYGYIGSGNSADSILVFDPARSINSEFNIPYGRAFTVADSFTHNLKHKISGLIFAIGNR